MNIGTHYDYNNHITFISTHTKIGTSHEKHHLRNGSEFADSAFSNVAASVCQCLSAIVSKLSTRDINQGLLIKHIQELAETSHRFIGSKRFTLVGGGCQ